MVVVFASWKKRAWESCQPPSPTMVRGRPVFCGLFASFLVCVASAQAAEKVLWQIGMPDYSTREFNDHWDFSQGHDPNFVVGKSDQKTDWTGFHQGKVDVLSGKRVHPLAVLFSLDDVPRGVFYLVVRVYQFVLDQGDAEDVSPFESIRRPWLSWIEHLPTKLDKQGYLVDFAARLAPLSY